MAAPCWPVVPLPPFLSWKPASPGHFTPLPTRALAPPSHVPVHTQLKASRCFLHALQDTSSQGLGLSQCLPAPPCSHLSLCALASDHSRTSPVTAGLALASPVPRKLFRCHAATAACRSGIMTDGGSSEKPLPAIQGRMLVFFSMDHCLQFYLCSC